uniref:F-box protein 34 n=1 Tax=Sphaeramia orbicularis TaxID=375764 RepID=A0A673ATR9_9TELE
MHLKSYPKLVRSELRLDPIPTASQRSTLFVGQQGALLRTCAGHHGNVSGGRLPLSVISTNTLSCCNNNNNMKGRMKLLPSPLPPPGRENEALGLYQTTAAETADAPLDVWTVIKPGNVREKIAIFASDGAACRPTRATKAKGSWEENGNAKRRRRSGSNQNLLQQHTNVLPQHLEPPRTEEAEPEDDPKVSVVEMVAFLEQRATEQQVDAKPLLAIQRSSASITLSRAPPPETRGEEPESVRVLDMVARLESECLRRQAEGELSRSSSLRRTVGRVLLAAATAASQHSHASCPPSSGEPVGCSEKTETPPPSDDAAGCEGKSQTEKKGEEAEPEPVPGLLFCLHLFTQTLPFRLQQLLEPQPYLAVLPHPLLVSIFVLLPTQSLAALKCTCHYFKFIIDNYGVRPADSLWKRYGRGDVSLCRWHHKPYCQALPYGPGYWMCCHGAHRDTPGCNVGLHDNRWVPAFHSINVPIYRGRRDGVANCTCDLRRFSLKRFLSQFRT